MEEVAERETERPRLAAGDEVDGEADRDAERERVREAHPGPAAVELHEIVGVELDAEDADPVDEPLRQEVRPPGADPNGDERDRDPLAELALNDVRIDVVSGIPSSAATSVSRVGPRTPTRLSSA